MARSFQEILRSRRVSAQRRRMAPLMRGLAYVQRQANPCACNGAAPTTTRNPSNAGLKYPFGRKLSGAQPKDLKDPFPNPNAQHPGTRRARAQLPAMMNPHGGGGHGSGGRVWGGGGWGRGWSGGYGAWGWPYGYGYGASYPYGYPFPYGFVVAQPRRRYAYAPWGGYASPYATYGAVVV